MKFRSKIHSEQVSDCGSGGFSLPSDAGIAWRDIAFSCVVTFCVLASLTVHAFADEADVVDVKATQAADKTWRFNVSVLHADAGWDHYADKWAVFGPNGNMLGERILAHPHDNEQPFTRSQSGIVIPDDVQTVVVKAHDKLHGWGGKEMSVKLDR